MRTSPPLLAPIFRSAGQAAILAEVLLTGETLGLAELARRAGVPKSSAHREVSRLVDAGLLGVETVGREWQVSSNPASPLTDPVRQVLLLAFGPVPLLQEHLGRIEGIEVAVIFGSFAARASGVPGAPPRDIDVLIIGHPDSRGVHDACRAVGDLVHRPVNATVMGPEEWADARARESAFAIDVAAHPSLGLIGELAHDGGGAGAVSAGRGR